MEQHLIHGGFCIQECMIRDGKKIYSGLTALKKGIRIESPAHDPQNMRGLKSAINEFNIKK